MLSVFGYLFWDNNVYRKKFCLEFKLNFRKIILNKLNVRIKDEVQFHIL